MSARAHRRPAAGALAMLVPAILLAASLVLADRPRVLILGPSAQHPMVIRVRDELAVLGYDVRIEIGAPAAGDLPSAAHRTGAVAVARIEAAPPAIELWVDAGQVAPAAETLREPRDPGLLALRAVELLRAHLLPVPPSIEPTASVVPYTPPTAEPAPPASAQPSAAPSVEPAPPPPPPRDVTAPAARPARGPFALLVAPSILLSPGGVPAAFHVKLGAEWDPIPRVGVELMGFVPTAASTVTSDQGSVDLRVVDLGGGIRGTLTDPESNFALALGLGLQAMLLMFDGHAMSPLVAQSGSRWAASPYAGASTGYRFHQRLAVRLDVVASMVRPEPVVRIGGRDAASFGQPAVFSSIGLEVRP
jgi:hypothetical protein